MAYKIHSISCNTRHTAKKLFMNQAQCSNPPVKKDAEHVFKDLKICKPCVMYLNLIDKITPYLNKHSKIKNMCMFIGEKIVKYTNNF